MTSSAIRLKDDPGSADVYVWRALPFYVLGSDLGECVRMLQEAVSRQGSTLATDEVSSALIVLCETSRRSGYDALACICRDILQQIEDSAAGGADTMSLHAFTLWVQHVDDYLGTPLSRQSASALIDAYRQISSHSPLCRSDRVLLVCALRRAGR